ncbi:MAG: phage tail tape measure protein, partial [Paraclostridium sp.]
ESLSRAIKINIDIGKDMVNSGYGNMADTQAKQVTELKEKYENLNKEYEQHQQKVKQTESAYKSFKQEVSSMKGELKETTASAEKFSNSLKLDEMYRDIDKLAGKMDLLDSAFRSSISNLEGLEGLFSRISFETDHLTKKINLNTNALKDYENVISHTQQSLDKLVDKFNTLNNKLDEQKRKLSSMNEGDIGYDETIREVIRLETEINSLNNEIDQHDQELLGLRTAHNNLQAEINETIREQNQLRTTMTGDYLDNFGNRMQEVGGIFQTAGMALMPLTAGIVALGGASIKTGTEFYASMSQVQAVSSASAKEIEVLTEKAREMGSTTIWSARDSADALSFMGLAGWNASQMVEGLPHVLNLASAGNTDLALTSDIVTDGLTAMGLQAKDAGMFTDVMAKTMSSSNTTVELMGETLKYAGNVAGGLGINMEDLSLAIGTMANAGELLCLCI